MPQAQRAQGQAFNVIIRTVVTLLISAYLFPELFTQFLSLFRFPDPLANHRFPEDTVATRFDTRAVGALATYRPTPDVLTSPGTDLIHFSPKSDGGLDVPSVAIHLFMSARTLVESTHPFMVFCALVNAAMQRLPLLHFPDLAEDGVPFEIRADSNLAFPGKLEKCTTPEFKETAVVACVRERQGGKLKFTGPTYCITIDPDNPSKAMPYIRLEGNAYMNPQTGSNCKINPLRISNGHANWVPRELALLGKTAKEIGLAVIGRHPDFRLLNPSYATDVARWGLYDQLHKQALAIDAEQPEAGIDDDGPHFRAT